MPKDVRLPPPCPQMKGGGSDAVLPDLSRGVPQGRDGRHPRGLRVSVLLEEGQALTEVRVPAPATLRRYGLTVDEWRAIRDAQGGTCGVCDKVPASGVLHIDHEHVRGWVKMKGPARRKYVRGLACWHCNSVWLRRGATPERLRRAAAYLESYANARAAPTEGRGKK